VPRDEGYPVLGSSHLLLFLKFYEPRGEHLTFVGTHVASNHHTLSDLVPVLRRAQRLAIDAELVVYEEVEFETSVRFEPITPGRSLKDCELQSGDIIVFQIAPSSGLPPLPASDVEMLTTEDDMSTTLDRTPTLPAVLEMEREPLATIPSFFEHVKNRVVVHVRTLPPQQHHGQGVCEKARALQIAMDKRWTYNQVTARVGSSLGVRPDHLRLTMHNPYSDLPKPQPIKYGGIESLQEMLTSFQKSTDQLFYEVLGIPLPEYEAKKSLKVSWHNLAAEEVSVHHLLLGKDATVGNALEELTITQLNASSAPGSQGQPLKSRRLRMMEVFNHRIYKIFSDNDEVESINDQYWTIRAEEIPDEELYAKPDDKLVHVRHFYRDTRMNITHNFGDPFLMHLGTDEKTASVRKRVQLKLSLSDEELERWKFAVISFGRVEYLEDDEVVKLRFRKHDNYGNWDDYLGLEHAPLANAARKKTIARGGYTDKPIKIHG